MGIIGNQELVLGLLYSLFFVASDVHLVHLVRHRVQARWILCCEFEDLEGEESAPVNLMMRVKGALDLLLLSLS